VPLFYSLGRTIIPAFGSVIAVITNVITILLTIKTLGIKGVALGTSLSLVFQSFFLLIVAFLKLKAPDFKFMTKSLLTLFVASFCLISVLKILDIFIDNIIFFLGCSLFLGALVFIGICKILGPRETYVFFIRLFKIFIRK